MNGGTSPRRDGRKVMPARTLPVSIRSASRQDGGAAGPADGSAGAPVRRRNWGSAGPARPPRSRGKMCTQTSRSGRPAIEGEDPGRSIRNWASIPASLCNPRGIGISASCARRLPLASGFRYDEPIVPVQQKRALMSDTTPARLIGMSGSLRSGSYSNAVLETLRERFAGLVLPGRPGPTGA